jgi:hydrogenase maturation protease
MSNGNNKHESLLICLGHEYRLDDAVGIFIGNHPKLSILPGLQILGDPADGIALMEAWKGKSLVILVDAVLAGKAPGTVVRVDALAAGIPGEISFLTSHQLNLAECIKLSRILGWLPERLILYGIQPLQTDYGIGLSEPVRIGAETAAERIYSEVTQALP